MDAGGDPNAVFIFQAPSTLVTDSASSVVLTGGAQACNVFLAPDVVQSLLLYPSAAPSR
jgi:Ice-binding-like